MSETIQTNRNRKGEKGAAMVMVLMISLLLLAAIGGLLLEVSMNTGNVSDAVAEQQAYNAAESGIQSAINVLRGNVLLDSSKPASDPVNQIDFRKAVSLSNSNANGDNSNKARLSRWISYNYTPSGATSPDRVTLNSGYQPGNGYAFSLEVSDPDNTGQIIWFEVPNSNAFYDSNTLQWKQSLTIGTTTFSYNPPVSVTQLDVSGGSANSNFGSFNVSSGAVNIADDIRFKIVVKMVAPYTATKEIRGWIKKGSYTAAQQIVFDFDSPVYQLMGSSITLGSDPMNVSRNSNTLITANLTQTEPYRVVVRATGYGPRGAKKVLEATVQKNFFNGLSAPATLTLIGPSAPTSASGFVFNAGSSQNVTYSGDDIYSNVVIPSIGTTRDDTLNSVFSTLDGRSRKADIYGPPANVAAEMPFWLESATNLHSTIESLKTVAKASGRYFASGQTPSNWGNNANATGITFVDGDVSLSGSGGGILVVTGKLTLHGGVDFNGLIIVTGAEGLDRRGGGNGILQGNTVIAPYNPNNLAAGFLAPKYDISGGGTSEIVYNSSSVANGMTAVSNFMLGVAEK